MYDLVQAGYVVLTLSTPGRGARMNYVAMLVRAGSTAVGSWIDIYCLTYLGRYCLTSVVHDVRSRVVMSQRLGVDSTVMRQQRPQESTGQSACGTIPL